MTNYFTECSTFSKKLSEKQFFFQNSYSEYENEISSISESSNSFSNDGKNEFDYFLEDKKEDLIQNNPISSSDDLSSLNSIEISKEEENKLYYVINDKNNENQNTAIENKNSSKSDSTQFITKKKRGRGKQNDSNDLNDSNDKIINVHDKFSPDNVLRKIQVHFINFIVLFLNDILKNLNYEQQFLKLDYSFKKNVNKKTVDSLKSQTIGEIICNKISIKYRKQDKNINKTIYEQIQNNEVLNKLLSEKYLKIFKKFYYKSNRIINLKEYGLDKDIILSKDVKMYKDLLKDNETFNEYKEYQKNLKECAIQNFLPDLIFTFN